MMHLSDEQIILEARELISNESQAIGELTQQIGGSFVQAARLLAACPGRVFVSGIGTSGAIARRLAHLLSCCGASAIYIHPADALHGASGAIKEQDVVIAISKGGQSDDVNQFVRIVKERGARVLAITAKLHSPLTDLSDLVLMVHVSPRSEQEQILPFGSSLASAALGDALCVVLMALKEYSWKEFAQTHPGGATGKEFASKLKTT